MHIYSFEKLDVWKEAVALSKQIYRLTNAFPKEEIFGLSAQMRRCSISIASNLAEGTARTAKNDKARFMTIAYGSTIELLNQIIISKELGFINSEEYADLRNSIESITNKINALKSYFLK